MATSTTPAKATATLEKALSSRLRGMSKTDIKAYADLINQMSNNGFKPDDVFPVGIIINSPDGAEVRGHVDGADIQKIVALLPTLKPQSVTIFPRGIVVQDNFRVHMKLQGGGI
ncbi:MAG: hypothetical protein JNM26_09820 [Ideonella sp.]|nr:hypothetical protein [Ideonella sp.]